MTTGTHSAGIAPPSAAGLGGGSPRPLARRDGSITILALIDDYMAEYAGRDPTRPQRLRLWVDRVGHLPLTELDDDVVHEAMEAFARRPGAYYAGRDVNGEPILRAKRKPLAPATLNRIQAALSAVLTWAQRRRITPKGWQNPCRLIELRPERNARVRFLTDDERSRLLAAARGSKWDRLSLFVLLALTTGARRGELEGLRWRDVDLERGEALVARSKNGDAKTLPLTPPVVAELRKFQAGADSLVFASKRRPAQVFNVVPVWKIALRDASIRDFRIHDMRHDAASTLARAGASLLEIGDLLGHRQQQVTRRYAHLCTDHKKRLVNKIMGDIK